MPIKVDREERPDVDRIYMLFVQASTGQRRLADVGVADAGAASRSSAARIFRPTIATDGPGFGAILENLAQAWREDRARDRGIRRAGAASSLQRVRRQASGGGRSGGQGSALDRRSIAFRRMFDSTLGGFGGAPKFPRPSVHNFLLRYYARDGK